MNGLGGDPRPLKPWIIASVIVGALIDTALLSYILTAPEPSSLGATIAVVIIATLGAATASAVIVGLARSATR